MKSSNSDDTPALVELGSVSGDTKGGPGKHWEGLGFEPTGLTAD